MPELKNINIGLMGLGTVGGGVYKLIERRQEEIEKKTGTHIQISKVLVRNLDKERPGVPASVLTDRWEDILEDDDIDIVVEVTGGIEPARTRIIQALNAGKNVVTANKDLIAEYGAELFETADNNGKDFLFEAAVAGGIPIIRPLKECLAGNEITEVMGIVNGTTNYILTRMSEDGMDFDEALAIAAELGYAEADPTADIEGYDAGRKVAIMASLAFHSHVTFADVDIEGITKLTAKDIKFAENFGKVIKLLGIAKNTDEGIEASVHPVLIDRNHPLASVRDAFNAVFVHGDAVDDAMFYGRGAGEFPTASAVTGDIIEAARNIASGCTGRISCAAYRDIPVKPADEVKDKYFLRIKAADRPGVMAGVTGVLGNNQISITQVVQTAAVDGEAEMVIMTDDVRRKHFRDALIILNEMSSVRKICSVIRVY